MENIFWHWIKDNNPFIISIDNFGIKYAMRTGDNNFIFSNLWEKEYFRNLKNNGTLIQQKLFFNKFKTDKKMINELIEDTLLNWIKNNNPLKCEHTMQTYSEELVPPVYWFKKYYAIDIGTLEDRENYFNKFKWPEIWNKLITKKN